jgi:hypothetical protein
MSNMQCIAPIAGGWYRSHGRLFEVVAVDDAEQVVEIQHADGDLEEIELEDWVTRCRAGSLAAAEAPEDPCLASDRDDGEDPGVVPSSIDELSGLRAEALGDLDLFE